MNCTTIYDITRDGFPGPKASSLLIGLAIGIVFVAILAALWRWRFKTGVVFYFIGLAAASLIVVANLVVTLTIYSKYRSAVDRLHAGDYSSAVGLVSDFQGGNRIRSTFRPESFWIGNHQFVADYAEGANVGYQVVPGRDTSIREGMRLRVDYADENILRIARISADSQSKECFSDTVR